MTNEERDLITRFIQRVGGAPAGGFGGSVPGTAPTQPLPPVDRDADALIAELFSRYPEARYRITQMAFMQEHALAEAQNQINRLQWELQNARQAQAQAPAQPAQSPWGAPAQPPPQQPSRGLFGGLFGGGQQAAPPQPPQPQNQPPQYAPPPPQYAPGYQPGMFQRQGSGFLGSALTTAAGVAGGMVAGHALMNLFSGGHGGGGFGTAAAAPFIPVETASPWASTPAAPSVDPYDVGGAPKDPAGWADQSQDQGWQQAASSPGGWDDANAAEPDAGGWDDASGGGGFDDYDNT
ncbi:DUF2076 domain-containing protein [Limobrevibacterium gyesilva]|uniref:DUF2076 domain-containing protein n=1 Tax=Limobrevibacterium gyesilva TaxID=2991712 RepID=A0AA42CGF9_9PROT|nr:DUF2076 domain-containing protein [Limobrevibacterium gyesilva]MCW3475996.1 DUF2076 domain-containing protein [Limobrevibacterium gyesilva]